MSLKYGLLGLLNYSSATGYDLKKVFDHSLNFFWQAHRSQIYKELTKLEKDGLLLVDRVVQDDRPNKKIYSITEEGRRDFLSWLREELQPDDFIVRESFLMKVFFMGELERGEAIKKLDSFILIHRQKLESYKEAGGHISDYSSLADKDKALYWSFTARHGIAYSRTCISWAQEAITLLQERG